MSNHIPFDRIRDAALAQAPQLLRDWFPAGKRSNGKEFVVGNLAGDPGDSLSINIATGKWSDFATGEGGFDFIDLYAAKHRTEDRTTAARELGALLGISAVNGHSHEPIQRKAAEGWYPIVPPPPDTPKPTPQQLQCDKLYEYYDQSDRLLFYVRRREARGDIRKQFFPLVYGTKDGVTGWHAKHPARPKPLYGLNRLSALPEASVILCEGEKASDAAQATFTDYACLSWCGGCESVDHADLAPLEGRDVILWGDNDPEGQEAVAKLLKRLPSARPLRVDDLPHKADAADVSVGDDPEAWLNARLPPDIIWDAGDDDYKIPPRSWLLGNIFCRRFLSSLQADGGVGKTALRVTQLISLAIGRSLTGEHVFLRCRVLIMSFEDGRDELRRRVYAVMRHHGISPADVKGWLFLASPKGLKLAQMQDGAPQVGAMVTFLQEAIDKYSLDVVSLDPFIKTHSMSENDNNAIDFACDLLTTVAIDKDCAIDAPHHTKKGLATPGNADNGRGASSMKDAARLVHTLTQMSPEEAKRFNVPESERRSLIRMDSGKVNIAPPSRDAKWFRIVGVPLGNGTELYPRGDEVQAVESWTPPNTWDGLDTTTLNTILDEIDKGMANGQRYSTASAATTKAAWRVVQKHAPDKTEPQCREVITAWTNSGCLFVEDYDDPVERKTRKGAHVNPSHRPS